MNKKTTTKKSIKPTYVVNMTWCENECDLRTSFVCAKVNNGIAITPDELMHMINLTIEFSSAAVASFLPVVCSICKCDAAVKQKTKLPWYKRFWGWLTGKKN